MRRRVAVTGIGVTSAIGTGVEDFWAACLAGATRVEPIPESWHAYADFASQLWSPLPAEARDIATEIVSTVERAHYDRATLIGLATAFQALADAGVRMIPAHARRRTFHLPDLKPEQISITVGTGIGGVSSMLSSFAHQALWRTKTTLGEVHDRLPADAPMRQALAQATDAMQSPTHLKRLAIPMAMPNACASALSIKLSVTGPQRTLCAACAAGTVAIGHAFRDVTDGRSDVALAGGIEFLDDAYGAIFRGFDIARTLVRGPHEHDQANRPFDRDRSGFLFSQGGSAMLVLEPLDHARARGARIWAEIVGFAESSDAWNVMVIAPSGEQIERVIHTALRDADLSPSQIDYVNAHGTGTRANDDVEAAVLHRVFGSGVAVNASKSLLGHTIGASGALEAAVTCLSLHHQTTHACRNLEHPIADLAFVREVFECPMTHAVSQSFAFGGHNAALVFRHVS